MAAKAKVIYVCKECGYETPKWLGRCPSCNEWNTIEESVEIKDSRVNPSISGEASSYSNIDDIELDKDDVKYATGDKEFDRVLGGGIVSGSIVLVGGEPGIGKSTLMLQIAMRVGSMKVLYVSGEESKHQIKMRYDRLTSNSRNSNIYLLNETNVDVVFQHANNLLPDMIIIDSIQTMYNTQFDSSPGSISQIRECTLMFQQYAKAKQIPVFLIGHITKEGAIAGPKVLEHIVDVVIMFEGEKNYGYRVLRTMKNRFGASSEMGMYLMQQNGLMEVSNPSEILMSKNIENLSGVCYAATIEGMRPIIIEVQALVSTTPYGMAQRTVTGFDLRRLNMLLAVLERRCNFKLSSKDIFLNITGGIKVDDPAIDMAVACAIISSVADIPINKNCCCAGEIGLSGEIRPVSHIEKRLSEAKKVGFTKMLVAGYGLEKLERTGLANIEIVGVDRISDVMKELW